MPDDVLHLLALRTRLRTLVVATTGGAAVQATADGFTRSTGSFLDDGFRQGMEVTPAGFGDTAPGLVEHVSATAMRIVGGRTAESGPGNLAVLLPDGAWEGTRFTPKDGRWYLEEDYVPGPRQVTTVGPDAAGLENDPMYVLRLYGVAGYGFEAQYRVAAAILNLFPPHLKLALANGRTLRVRGKPAPWRGQMTEPAAKPGRSLVVVTIPLRTRSDQPY